jgi:hypothetical protein
VCAALQLVESHTQSSVSPWLKTLLQVLWLSRRWYFKSRSFGLWSHCCIMVGYRHFRGPGLRWRQHGPLKHWYTTTTRHGVTTQKTSTWKCCYAQNCYGVNVYNNKYDRYVNFHSKARTENNSIELQCCIEPLSQCWWNNYISIKEMLAFKVM